MFTGLIETIGTISDLRRESRGARIGIAPGIPDFPLAPGDSVSVNGACLTFEESLGSRLYFSAVEETLKRTTLGDLRPGARVNLERALRSDGRLGGHFVLGHIDAVGTIASDEPRGESILRTITVPAGIVPFLAEKGSVAIDGVSLTIARTLPEAITLSLIPYSLRHTTLASHKSNDHVNIECDILSRYIVHYLKSMRPAREEAEKKEALIQTLERLGF